MLESSASVNTFCSAGKPTAGKAAPLNEVAGNAHVEPGLDEPARGESPAVVRLPRRAELAFEHGHYENAAGRLIRGQHASNGDILDNVVLSHEQSAARFGINRRQAIGRIKTAGKARVGANAKPVHAENAVAELCAGGRNVRLKELVDVRKPQTGRILNAGGPGWIFKSAQVLQVVHIQLDAGIGVDRGADGARSPTGSTMTCPGAAAPPTEA